MCKKNKKQQQQKIHDLVVQLSMINQVENKMSVHVPQTLSGY